mmetsp:Transcript_3570/g.9725  ORF Transcript_3570/g.9725 Transcript_3570/m.9725 type:complete len:330 (+) Transcript_3570:40-1029(+)
MSKQPQATSGWLGVFWMFVWLGLNILCTLMNKAIFQFGHFRFPIFLSSIHMLFSFIGSSSALYCLDTKRVSVTWPVGVGILFMLSLVFCSNIVISNVSLRLITISLSQVIRSTIPGFTMAVSAVMLRRTYSLKQVTIVFFVCIGVAMATFGEIEFSLIGTVFAFLGCLLSSLKAVLANMLLGGNSRYFIDPETNESAKFHPFDLLNWMSLFAFWEMSIIASTTGEHQELVEWEGGLVFSLKFLGLLAANGSVAFLLNIANFNFIRTTSALTMSVCGNVKCVLTILISVVLFQNPISTLNALGTVITIVTAAIYSYVSYQLQQQQKAEAK